MIRQQHVDKVKLEKVHTKSKSAVICLSCCTLGINNPYRWSYWEKNCIEIGWKTKTFKFRNLALFSPWLSVSLISETVKDRGYLSIYYQKLLTKSIQSKNLLLPGKEPDSLNECIWFRLKNSAQCRATRQVFYKLFTFKIIPNLQLKLDEK